MRAAIRAWKQCEMLLQLLVLGLVVLKLESEADLNIQQYVHSFFAEKAPDCKRMMLASQFHALLDACLSISCAA